MPASDECTRRLSECTALHSQPLFKSTRRTALDVAITARRRRLNRVTRGSGLLLLFAIIALVIGGCSQRVAAPEPEVVKTSPAVSVAGPSESPAEAPTPVTPILSRGAPLHAVDGDREENVLYAPASLALRDGRFDLIVHFKGKPQTTIDALEQSGIPAVIVNVDLKVDSVATHSTDYRSAYEDVAAFDHLIAFAEREVRRSGRVGTSNASVGRIAISAWSAGYGAAREIMQRRADVARVDALLLVDGFYGDWENKRARTVDPEDVAATLGFARRAKSGEKLFVLTHTALDFRAYAGGAEAADVLLRYLALEKVPSQAGQRRAGAKEQYAVEVEGLHVVGFKGQKFADHVAQHRAMGAVHYGELRKYWMSAKERSR